MTYSAVEMSSPIVRIGMLLFAVLCVVGGVIALANGKIVGLVLVGFGLGCAVLALRRGPARIQVTGPDDDPELRAIRQQMQRGDFAGAKERFARCTDLAEREYYLMALTKFDGRPACFDKWVAAEPAAAAPWLLRGYHGLRWAWEARSSARASEVSEQAWGIFYERLEVAWDDLENAGDRDPRDPLPPAQMIRVAMGQAREHEEAWALFQRAVALAPDCYAAHEAMMIYLCQKWLGSHEAMFQFARQAGGRAQQGSNVPAVIAYAHIERWLYAAGFDEDPDAKQYFEAPEIRAEIEAAYHKSLGSPVYRPSQLTHRLQNYFAFALARAGSVELARTLFEQIGDRPTEDPWQYLDSPAQAYAAVRRAIGK